MRKGSCWANTLTSLSLSGIIPVHILCAFPEGPAALSPGHPQWTARWWTHFGFLSFPLHFPQSHLVSWSLLPNKEPALQSLGSAFRRIQIRTPVLSAAPCEELLNAYKGGTFQITPQRLAVPAPGAPSPPQDAWRCTHGGGKVSRHHYLFLFPLRVCLRREEEGAVFGAWVAKGQSRSDPRGWQSRETH